MILQIERVHLSRQSQIEELMGGIQDMCTPVAQSTHAIVIPATPLTQVVIVVVIVILRYTNPRVPIHGLRNGLTHRHVRDMRVPTVPTAGVVHVCGDGSHIFDDTRLFPSLELEIVSLRVSLVTHLGDNSKFLGCPHHDLDLLKGACHRFLHIDMFAMCHRLNRDGEVRMVRHTNRYGINLVCDAVEHRSEILETFRLGEHIHDLLRMRSAHIHIAEGDYIT